MRPADKKYRVMSDGMKNRACETLEHALRIKARWDSLGRVDCWSGKSVTTIIKKHGRQVS